LLIEVFVTPWGIEKLMQQGLIDVSSRADTMAIKWAAQALLADALMLGVNPKHEP
jgi:hypothetical protein